MKKLMIIILITLSSPLVKAQYSIGKSFQKVHDQYLKLKGNNPKVFIEIEEATSSSNARISYGFKDDYKKQTIYLFTCDFNRSQICYMEIWAAFKTKEEAMTWLQKEIPSEELKHLKTDFQNRFDQYVVYRTGGDLLIYLTNGDNGFKEFQIIFVDSSLKDK